MQRSDAAFACQLNDADLVKACAPEQPEQVQVAQHWMNCATGDSYPVRHIERGSIYLGSASYTIFLTEDLLRRDYVCTDPPRPVSELRP